MSPQTYTRSDHAGEEPDVSSARLTTGEPNIGTRQARTKANLDHAPTKVSTVVPITSGVPIL